ncbi:MAG TPA: type II toxin-antitoxin system RelE/ParE family toxin [Caulobacteraceae bacterium]
MRDIEDIWLYIAADNVNAATRVLDLIEQAEMRLCEFPDLGQARPEVRADLRHWPVGSYLVVYRVTSSRLEIVRVVHGARNLVDLFDEDL